VLSETQDLFLELATEPEQLEFPVIYAIAKQGVAMLDPARPGTDLRPLFEAIVHSVPAPRIGDGPLQMLVTTLGYDSYQGRIAIGRMFRGEVKPGDSVAVIGRQGSIRTSKVAAVYSFEGLQRLAVEAGTPGDIVALTGIEDASIGETIAAAELPEALPGIEVEEPTVRMTIGVNTSPFSGREGKMGTSRQIRERLFRELETNVALRVEETSRADTFLVSGRGELHLAILVETMRREGYEFEVSRPEVITRQIDGHTYEPFEQLVIDTTDDNVGFVTQAIAARKGVMTNMHSSESGDVRFEFTIPTRGLIGFRNEFLTATRGNGVMNSLLLGYRPWAGDITSYRMGALVALEEGQAVSYGLSNAQDRGTTFIEPGTPVYGGMIVGLNSRGDDIVINVCKDKKKTNVRSSTSDILVRLTPATILSLEQSLDFIADDELLEVTPESLRLRKRILSHELRGKRSK